MGRHAKRSYLIDLVNQSHIDQEKNCHFCSKSNCSFWQRNQNLEGELREKEFHVKNTKVKNWFIIYFQKDNNKITVFPVSK